MARLDDLLIGDGEYENSKNNIYKLRGEGEHRWKETTTHMHRAQEEAEKRIELCRQVHFLKQYLKNISTRESAVMRIPSTLTDIPLDTPPATPTPKRQYGRYLDEAEEYEAIQLTRATLMTSRLQSEYELLREHNAVKEKERDQLMEKLGIESIAQIQALIPKRASGENIRVQFGQ